MNKIVVFVCCATVLLVAAGYTDALQTDLSPSEPVSAGAYDDQHQEPVFATNNVQSGTDTTFLELDLEMKEKLKIHPVLIITFISLGITAAEYGVRIVTHFWARMKAKQVFKVADDLMKKVMAKSEELKAFAGEFQTLLHKQMDKTKELAKFIVESKQNFAGVELPADLRYFITSYEVEQKRKNNEKLDEYEENIPSPDLLTTFTDVNKVVEKVFKTQTSETDKAINMEAILTEIMITMKTSTTEGSKLNQLLSHGGPLPAPSILGSNPFLSMGYAVGVSAVGLTGTVINIAMTITDTVDIVSHCSAVHNMYIQEMNVLVKDLDYEYCRLYSNVWEAVQKSFEQYHQWLASFHSTTDAAQLNQLIKDNIAIHNEIKKLVHSKLMSTECKHFFSLQPRGTPIRLMYGSFDRQTLKDTEYVSVKVEFQPSVVSTRMSTKHTTVGVWKPASIPSCPVENPRFKKELIVKKLEEAKQKPNHPHQGVELKQVEDGTVDISDMFRPEEVVFENIDPHSVTREWMNGCDELLPPITHMFQRYIAKEQKHKFKFADILGGDMRSMGLFGASYFEPVVVSAEAARRYDAIRQAEHLCATFPKEKRTVSQQMRCLRLSNQSPLASAAEIFKHERIGFECLDFAAPPKYRALFKVGKTDTELLAQPALLLYTNRDPGAPIVSFSQDKPDHCDTSDACFLIPFIREDLGGEACYDQEIVGYYVKDWSLPKPSAMIEEELAVDDKATSPTDGTSAPKDKRVKSPTDKPVAAPVLVHDQEPSPRAMNPLDLEFLDHDQPMKPMRNPLAGPPSGDYDMFLTQYSSSGAFSKENSIVLEMPSALFSPRGEDEVEPKKATPTQGHKKRFSSRRSDVLLNDIRKWLLTQNKPTNKRK